MKTTSSLFAFLVATTALFSFSAHSRAANAANAAAQSARQIISLDEGWRFAHGNAADLTKDFGFGAHNTFAKVGQTDGPANPKFDDSKWKKINVPHDWVVHLPFDKSSRSQNGFDYQSHGFKPVGRAFPENSVGWYRRDIGGITKADKGQRFILDFDGVFRDAQIWVNGYYLGHHASGYAPFWFDISDYLHYGKKNTLVVRADDLYASGWFYEGAGIYRHVWLTKEAPLHIAHWRTYVRTKVVPSHAEVTAQTTVQNQTGKDADFSVVTEVVDASGKTVSTGVKPAKLANGESSTLTTSMFVYKPQLWGIKRPYLYSLITKIMERGKVIDETHTPFGIRTIKFTADNGFLLNGKRVEIHGVCCHQDAAGVGIGVPDALLRWRLAKLKQMGCNAYRTSHNAPAKELTEICDRLGILVMDENRYPQRTPAGIRNFKNLILRDRNNPSVILWSLGNEEGDIQRTPVGAAIGKDLKSLAHRLDPSRPVTYASNAGNNSNGLDSIVDVHGFNYHTSALVPFHKAHPKMPMFGSEVASTIGTRGIYKNDKAKGFIGAYDVNKVPWGATAEGWWKFYVAHPFLAGGFVWTGFDYRGEPTPYGWPDISSQFGIMDTCGFPKDIYYYYQSWWTKKPVLHIFPHWNWPDKIGKPIDVWCFSNCANVELFLNGKSLGKKAMPANGHLEWKVNYEPGTLLAKGFDKTGKEILTQKIETTGAPAKVALMPDRTTLNANERDVCVVNVAISDTKNRVVPTANNLVQFSVSPNAKIIGVGNGDPTCHESDQGNQRSAFNGYCQVLVQTTHTAGAITLTAKSDGLQPATATLQAK